MSQKLKTNYENIMGNHKKDYKIEVIAAIGLTIAILFSIVFIKVNERIQGAIYERKTFTGVNQSNRNP